MIPFARFSLCITAPDHRITVKITFLTFFVSVSTAVVATFVISPDVNPSKCPPITKDGRGKFISKKMKVQFNKKKEEKKEIII